MSSTVTATSRQYTAANSEYHSISNAAQTGLNPGDTNFYLAGWIYANTLGTNIIVSKWQSGGAINAYELYYASSQLTWIGTAAGTTVSYSVNCGALSTGTWYFVECYHDATNNVVGVTYNRNADTTSSYSGGLYGAGTADFAIGSGMSAFSPWNGRIHGFVAISGIPTTAERNALYNAGAGVLYKDRPTLSLATYISWWDGAETSGVLIDALGTNTLTDNNTVTSAAGNITYTAEDASQFTAANSEYLSVATSGGLAPGNNDFTVTGWVYMDSSGTDRGLVSVLDFGGGFGNNYSWVILYVGATAKIRFDVDSLGTAGAGLHSVSCLNAISTGAWYFFCARHDATADTIEMRVNGEAFQSTSHASGAYAGTAPFRISGYGIVAVTAFHNGRMAGVNYWNAKLSDANVDALYQRGFGRDFSEAPTTTGLVAWWECTEASGNRADSFGTFTLTDNNTVTGNPGVVYDAPAVITFKPHMLLFGVG